MLIRSMSARAALVAFLIAAFAVPAGAATVGKHKIHALMLNTGAARSARGKIVMVQNKTGSAFTIKIDGMTKGATYDVIVDGVVRDAITTNAGGHGQVTHQARVRAKRSSSLPYNPSGARVQIASAGTVILSADVPSTPDDSDNPTEIKLDLTAATGVAGSSSAEFRDLGGRMKFEVRIEGATPGTYDLIVAGSNVGQVIVGTDGSGEIRFDSSPSTSVCGDNGDVDDDSNDTGDSMDLLLTFDPRGQTIELQQAGIAEFSGTLPATPPPAGDDDGGDNPGGEGGD